MPEIVKIHIGQERLTLSKPPTMSTEDKLRVLKRARALLARPYGWAQHEWKTKKNWRDSYCINGACNVAYNELLATEYNSRVLPHSEQVGLGLSLHNFVKGQGYEDIVSYNDTVGRKKKVLELMDAYIAKVKAEQ